MSFSFFPILYAQQNIFIKNQRRIGLNESIVQCRHRSSKRIFCILFNRDVISLYLYRVYRVIVIKYQNNG